jgi:hypothetical protein
MITELSTNVARQYEISRNMPATHDEILRCTSKLQIIFSQTPSSIISVLNDVIREKRYSIKVLAEAYRKLVETHKYRAITIADFVEAANEIKSTQVVKHYAFQVKKLVEEGASPDEFELCDELDEGKYRQWVRISTLK